VPASDPLHLSVTISAGARKIWPNRRTAEESVFIDFEELFFPELVRVEDILYVGYIF
jgi:hypothetical protein